MLMILMGGVLLWQGWRLNGVLLMLIGWFGFGANRSQTQMLVADGAAGVEGVGCGRQTFPRAGGGSEPAPLSSCG